MHVCVRRSHGKGTSPFEIYNEMKTAFDDEAGSKMIGCLCMMNSGAEGIHSDLMNCLKISKIPSVTITD